MESPSHELRRLHTMGSPWVCQSLYVAAKLGLADQVKDGPVAVAELAARTDAHEDALYRFCRVLAGLGVLTAEPGRCFGLGPLGGPLLTDTPGSVRYAFVMQGEEIFRAWAEVLYTVRTGKPAFDQAIGMGYFQHLAETPGAGGTFSGAMGGYEAPPAILDQYDLTGRRTVVDLGGGAGTVLAAVLRREPAARGVLVEVPACAGDARTNLDRLGVGERCSVVAGDFFTDVPPGDLYILSRVLHNWDDADALRLLRRVAAEMDDRARLLIIDHLLPGDGSHHPGLFTDLHMLVVLGGRERNEEELTELLAAAGLRMLRRIGEPDGDDPRAQCAVEAARADGGAA